MPNKVRRAVKATHPRVCANAPHLEPVQTKRCAQCGAEKEINAFLPSKFTSDGQTESCKPCIYADAERDRHDREQRRRNAEQKKREREDPPSGVTTKACKTCHVAKPMEEFHRHGLAKDGRRHSCKSCSTRKLIANKQTLSRDDLAAGHERHLANNHCAVKRWQAANVEAVRAKSAVHRALKTGVLAKPKRCQAYRCKSRAKLEAHHHSYENPLSVTWLCRAHHNELHKGEEITLAVGLPPTLAAEPKKKAG